MGKIRLVTVASVVLLNVMGCLLFLRTADELPSVESSGVPLIIPQEYSPHSIHKLPKRSPQEIDPIPDLNVTYNISETKEPIVIISTTPKTTTKVLDEITPSSTNIVTLFQNSSTTESLTNFTLLTATESVGNATLPTKFISSAHFQYVINQPQLCSNESFELLVMVCSAVKNFRQRRAIRKTWGSVAGEKNSQQYDVRILFLLGLPKDQTTQNLLLEESSKYSDVLQENFLDSYRNLTLKSVMLLRWVTEFCPNVKFILKVDDDMFLHLPNLLRLLHTKLSKSTNGLLAGALNQGAKPIRTESHKWYVPHNQFPGKVYPDYLSGTAYLMSRDVAPKLYAAAHTTPFLAMEDIFITGVCASKAGVKRKMLPGFVYWKRAPTGCAFKNAISGHYVSMSDMFTIWRDLKKTDLRCVKATLKTNRIRRGTNPNKPARPRRNLRRFN